MDIEVEGPDGVILTFPSGTSKEVMREAMRKRYGGAAEAPKPQEGVEKARAALAAHGQSFAPSGGKHVEMSDDDIAQSRANSMADLPPALRATLPFINGTTLGLGDELASVAAAPFGPNSLAENFSATQKAFERELDRARSENPKSQLAAELGGNVAGVLATAPSGIVNAMLKGGAGMLPRMGAGAADGAILGTLGAIGNTRTDEEYASGKNAAGVGLSALMGGAAPVVGDMLATGANSAINRLSLALSDSPLKGVPMKAQRWLFDNAADPQAAAEITARLQQLGPNAVLADASPEFAMMARGAASRPGSRKEIVDVLTTRDAGKNARLADTADANLGKVVEPSVARAEIDAAKRAVGPEYDAALASAGGPALPVDLPARVPAVKGSAITPGAGAVQKAIANITDDPRSMMDARRFLDDAISEASRSGRNQEVRALTMARNEIDQALGEIAPGIKGADAKYAALSREGDALDAGAMAFRTGPESARPYDFAGQMKALEPPAALRMQQGARAEIDRVLGSNANDVAAARNMLKGEGDWNRQKLDTLYGPEKSKAFLQDLDNESVMEGTYRQIVGGSQTAPSQGFREFLDETAKGNRVPIDASATGLLLRGAQKSFEKITGNDNSAKADAFAKALGSLSVSKQQDAMRIVNALAGAAKTNSNVRKTVNAIVQRGGVGALIGLLAQN